MKLIKWIQNLVSDDRGFSLITSYMVIAAISIYSLAMFSHHNMFYQANERNQNRIVAFNMAEAGLDTAMIELGNDPNYAGTGGFVSMNSGTTQGGYSVMVCPPTCTGLTQPTNASTRLVSVTGSAPIDPSGDTSTVFEESRSVTAYSYFPPANFFDFAIFADESMQINGNPLVDSYDSSVAPYDVNTAGANADIGTNGIGNGDVAIIGNATVNGDATVGPGSDPNNVISITGNSATLNGTSSAATEEQTYSTPSIPAGATYLGVLSVGGNNTYTLAAGTYQVDSLSVTGNGTLSATGEVKIYTTGSVNIAGNGVSTSGNTPPNFLLFSTSSDSVQVSGNGDFYGGIYAPDADVQISGNGDLYGAVVSNTFQQSGNGDMHFDESMTSIDGGSSSSVELLSWVEEGALLSA